MASSPTPDERRQRVLALLAEGQKLVEGINGHMTEIEQLLKMDEEEAAHNG